MPLSSPDLATGFEDYLLDYLRPPITAITAAHQRTNPIHQDQRSQCRRYSQKY